jgi:REP-associated tyrosine transposase
MSTETIMSRFQRPAYGRASVGNVPRKLRIQVPDVTYHVGSRGVEKRPIFDVIENDRIYFLVLLERVVRKYKWICHAYCLMGNHFHLLVETPEANIAAGMQYLKGRYATWFNQECERVGALFERRYFGELVETEGHAYELARYLVLNPVRANLCTHPRDWVWSSYCAEVGLVRRPPFLQPGYVRDLFGEGTPGIARYERFVEDGLSYLRLDTAA